MRKARFFNVAYGFVGKFAVAEIIAVGVFAPRAYMHFVYAHGRAVGVGFFARNHIFRIRKFYFRQIIYFARKTAAVFAVNSVGVRFVKRSSVLRLYNVFVVVEFFNAARRARPNSALARKRNGLPTAEIARNGNRFRARRKHRKTCFLSSQFATEVFVAVGLRSVIECVNIIFVH